MLIELAGPAVDANVTLAVTDRIRVGAGEWADGPTTFYDITVWGSPAEPFTIAATKRTRLAVVGELATKEWTDREGATHTRRKITAEHGGICVRFHPATTTRD